MSPKRQFSILAVDDDPDVLESLRKELKDNTLNLMVAPDGEKGLSLIREKSPDLVILDITMPCLSGLEICEIMRKDKAYSHLPIILLSGRSLDIDRIMGLEIGADDYVTKPFNVRELVLRIKGILRRVYGAAEQEEVIRLGELSVDHAAYEVKVEDEPVNLTVTEFRLLASLVENPGRVKTREALLDEIWEHADGVFSRTVDTHIQRLRNKLNKAGRYIETVRGVGYRFRLDES